MILKYLILLVIIQHFAPVHPKIIDCKVRTIDGEILKECNEICPNGCPNGQCSHKQKSCICNKGYQMIEEKCEVDACKNKCGENFICVGLNKCKCKDGYKDTNGICKPVCLKGCQENSKCIAPEKCECNAGYLSNKDKCQPICLNECGENFKCIAPGKCQCKKGYLEAESICKPICSNKCGENSFCASPEKCQCEVGYAEYQGTCRPICMNGCGENYKCIAPNSCQCKEGFQEINGNCQLLCSQDCGENSKCIEPNTCHCKNGYSSYNATCNPICITDCGKNSECVAPDTCQCIPGNYLDAEKNCVLGQPYNDCSKRIGHLYVSCGYFLFLFYTSLAFLMLVVLWGTYKGYNHLVQSIRISKTKPNYNNNGGYAVGFEQRFTEFDNDEENLVIPPVYNATTSGKLLVA